MEAFLTSKPRSAVVGVLRALSEPFKEHWGDLDSFREAGMAVLQNTGGGILADPEKGPELLETLYARVLPSRAVHFRPMEEEARLEQFLRELDATAAKKPNPLQQGVLWLASRFQLEAIRHLHSPTGQAQLKQVYKSAEAFKADLVRPLTGKDNLNMEQVSGAVSSFTRKVLGEGQGRYDISAIAGHVIEVCRINARRAPDVAMEGDDIPEYSEASPILSIMTEFVYTAELNEARLRYATLNEEQRAQNFNKFRISLGGVIKKVAPFAPEGLSMFCRAIEAYLYPYPQRIEYIHSFAKSVHANGQQSTLFDDCATPQSVRARFSNLREGGKVNPLILELGMAFALRNFKNTDSTTKREFMRDLDLHSEFHWPSTMRELLEDMQKGRA